MLWFVWTILGTFFHSLERIIDKRIVIGKEATLDPLVAAFYRNLAFYLFVLIIGFLGLFGRVSFFFALPLVIWSVFQVFSSVIYDYFLKNAEIVRYNGITFIVPLLLILIDQYVFSFSFAIVDIFAILLLVGGGYVITLNAQTRKNVFSFKQWLLLLVDFLVGVVLYVLFKYYNTSFGVNEVSFYASTWLFVMLFFVFFIIVKGKRSIVRETGLSHHFFLKTLLSKFFDTLSSLFIFKAVSLGAITRVYALESISPLVSLVLVVILVKIFGMDLKETLDKKNLGYKFVGAVLLGVGSYLIV